MRPGDVTRTPTMVERLRAALHESDEKLRRAVALEQRYLLLLKALVARSKGGTTAVTDAEVAAAYDARLGMRPHGEVGTALMVRPVGSDFGETADPLAGMDARMTERMKDGPG